MGHHQEPLLWVRANRLLGTGGSEESRPSPKVQPATLGITELPSGPSLLGAWSNPSQQGGQEKVPVVVGWGKWGRERDYVVVT